MDKINKKDYELCSIDEIINSILQEELKIEDSNSNDSSVFNDKKTSNPPINIFLGEGLVGKCLFLFWYSKYTNNTEFRDLAYNFLSIVRSRIDINDNLTLYNGLLGVVFSCAFSINNNYVLGDIDNICKNVDDLMYVYTSRRQDSKTFITDALDFIMDYMLYLTYRLNISLKNRTERIIYEKTLLFWLNRIYSQHKLEFFEEPSPGNSNYHTAKLFLVMSRMYYLGIEKERLIHILDELKFRILYKIPFLHHNRIVLLCALKDMEQIIPLDEDWKRYINMVNDNVSISDFICNEMDSLNMFGDAGLVGLYAWFKYVNREKKIIKIPYSVIHEKCEHCLMTYNLLDTKNFNYIKKGLLGRLGLIMMYYDTNNTIK